MVSATHTPKWKQFLSLNSNKNDNNHINHENDFTNRDSTTESVSSTAPSTLKPLLKRKRGEDPTQNKGFISSKTSNKNLDHLTASNTAINSGQKSVDSLTQGTIETVSRKKQVEQDKIDPETIKQVSAYLKTFCEDKCHWKFNKAKQNSILRHWNDETVFPEKQDTDWLVQYMSSIQGASRDLVIKDTKMVKKAREASLLENEEKLKNLQQVEQDEENKEVKKVKRAVKFDKRMKKRAEKILKAIKE